MDIVNSESSRAGFVKGVNKRPWRYSTVSSSGRLRRITQQMDHYAVLEYMTASGWSRYDFENSTILYKNKFDGIVNPILIGHTGNVWLFIQPSNTKDAIDSLIKRLNRGITVTCPNGHVWNTSWYVRETCNKCGELVIEKTQ